jgi:hypothetical protein
VRFAIVTFFCFITLSDAKAIQCPFDQNADGAAELRGVKISLQDRVPIREHAEAFAFVQAKFAGGE